MTQLTGSTTFGKSTDQKQGCDVNRPTVFSDYYQLIKPRLTLLVLVTVMIGFGMGAADLSLAGQQLALLAATLLGTALACVGAGVFNQIIERKHDAKMDRTASRPLVTGRISLRHAYGLALVTSIGGVGLIVLFVNPLAAFLVGVTIFAYTLMYTPMKRINSTSTIVGALPGALPPVIGYAAATGEIGPAAVWLFLILFLWQLPHFLAIAWLYRDDYARAGMPMLPVVDQAGASTFRQILLGCFALLPLGLMPVVVGVSGMVYFGVALIAGLVFLVYGIRLVLGKTQRDARRLFIASLVYLPTVMVAMLVDKV